MTSYDGYEISTDSITNANTLFRFVEEYELTADERQRKSNNCQTLSIFEIVHHK